MQSWKCGSMKDRAKNAGVQKKGAETGNWPAILEPWNYRNFLLSIQGEVEDHSALLCHRIDSGRKLLLTPDDKLCCMQISQCTLQGTRHCKALIFSYVDTMMHKVQSKGKAPTPAETKSLKHNQALNSAALVLAEEECNEQTKRANECARIVTTLQKKTIEERVMTILEKFEHGHGFLLLEALALSYKWHAFFIKPDIQKEMCSILDPGSFGFGEFALFSDMFKYMSESFATALCNPLSLAFTALELLLIIVQWRKGYITKEKRDSCMAKAVGSFVCGCMGSVIVGTTSGSVASLFGGPALAAPVGAIGSGLGYMWFARMFSKVVAKKFQRWEAKRIQKNSTKMFQLNDTTPNSEIERHFVDSFKQYRERFGSSNKNKLARKCLQLAAYWNNIVVQRKKQGRWDLLCMRH